VIGFWGIVGFKHGKKLLAINAQLTEGQDQEHVVFKIVFFFFFNLN
jgi:hypothetical protein